MTCLRITVTLAIALTAPDLVHAQEEKSVPSSEQQAPDQKPSEMTHRFDGAWQATITCVPAAGAKGYTLRFTAEVKEGNFHAQRGTEGKPNSMTLDGQIQPDGSADILASGLTGDSNFTVGNLAPGTLISYSIQAKFEGPSASGSRAELRPCRFTALKR
jgi:hypothetical protein